MTLRARSGAALAMALVLLVVLDCIVLGTLHISLQEYRIGQNRQGVLQLRLDAESALRSVAGGWPAVLDSIAPGSATSVPHGVPTVQVIVERLGADLYVMDAVAIEPAPRAGRAAVRMLVNPPVLPREIDPAPAALSASGPVRVLPTGTVRAGSPACARAPATHAIRLADPAALIVESGGVVETSAGPLPSLPLSPEFDRIAALSNGRTAVQIIAGDTAMAGTITGILIVDGDFALGTGARFEGMMIVRGALTLAAGSVITGAVHAGRVAVVGGEIMADPCLVDRVVDAARFRSAVPAGARPRLPAFGL